MRGSTEKEEGIEKPEPRNHWSHEGPYRREFSTNSIFTPRRQAKVGDLRKKREGVNAKPLKFQYHGAAKGEIRVARKRTVGRQRKRHEKGTSGKSCGGGPSTKSKKAPSSPWRIAGPLPWWKKKPGA